MLRIPDRALPIEVSRRLEMYQAEVDAFPSYAQQVEEAKKRFKRRNNKTNSAFRVVRQVLGEMCSGARRCMYCEDSVADEVEHSKPKDFYPGAVFVWENYLYACGPCNSGKNNKFPLFSAKTGTIIHLTRLPGAPVLEPEAGIPVLPDLRLEDPFELLRLDLLDTFFFQPSVSDPTSMGYLRAEQVIDILGLNARDYLCRARAEAYISYYARLEQYVVRRNAGAVEEELLRLRRSLRRMGHLGLGRDEEATGADPYLARTLYSLSRGPELVRRCGVEEACQRMRNWGDPRDVVVLVAVKQPEIVLDRNLRNQARNRFGVRALKDFLVNDARETAMPSGGL